MGKKTEGGGTLASLGNHPLVILLTLLGNAFDRNNGREGYRRHRRHRISLKGPHQIQLAWCSISATLRFSSSSWATVRGYFSFFFRQWERDGGLGKKEGRGTSPELPPIPRPQSPREKDNILRTVLVEWYITHRALGTTPGTCCNTLSPPQHPSSPTTPTQVPGVVPSASAPKRKSGVLVQLFPSVRFFFLARPAAW